MPNISSIHHCYGCSLCATVCSKKIISITLNKNGFYEPTITDTTQCTDCSLCMEVCAFANKELANNDNRPIKSYAAWSKNMPCNVNVHRAAQVTNWDAR